MHKILKNVFSCFLAISFSGMVFADAAKPEILLDKSPNKDLDAISALAVSKISRSHLVSGEFDKAKQELMFQSLLKTLDPYKMFLLQQEVDSFHDYLVKNSAKLQRGDLSLVFMVFNLVQKRYCEYAAAAGKILAEDTSGLMSSENLNMELDRKDSPWLKTPEEMRQLWRNKVINDIISLRLIELAAEKEKAEGKNDGESEDVFVKNKTPEERLKKRIELTVNYYRNLKPIDVVEFFLNAVAASYDPHTAYMTPQTDEDFTIDMSLKLIGIGATLTNVDGYTKVVSLVPGGPAEKQGQLQPGDRIIAVAQEGKEAEDIIDMPLNDVVRKIRGKADTKVTLTVLSAKKGLNSVPVKITIVRKEVIVKDSEAKGEIRTIKADSGEERKIGIITLPSFYMDFDAAHHGDKDYKCASQDVKKILLDFKAKNVDGVVMDLRSNGGGSLPDAINLCGLFIKDGPMVQVKAGNDLEICTDMDGGECIYDGPMVVAVNRLSASAAEIFAGAMQDYGRAVIVGDAKTHGKGTVQTLASLDRWIIFLVGKRLKAGSLKVTCAKFYRINGESTQLKGVIPDVILPSFFDSMDMGEDKLDNPLPWDRIASSSYDMAPGHIVLRASVPFLQEASAKRIQESNDFKALQADIERYKKMKDQKTIPLNLEKRWKKYMEEKKISDEQAKLFKLDADTKVKGKKNKDKDIYLDESVQILNDLISIQKKQISGK